MNRSSAQRWVAAVWWLAGMGGAVAAPAYSGIPMTHVSVQSRFVPQILYVPSRVPPLLVLSPLTVSGPSLRIVDMGLQAPVVFNVHYTGDSASLDVISDPKVFTGAPTIQQLDADDFKVTLTTSDRLAAGNYKSTVSFRMCAVMPCANPTAATSKSLIVSVRWVNPGEWETFQRDARHDGYVPVVIRPSSIRFAWEWQRPSPPSGDYPSINSIVSSGGRLFVSDSVWFDVASIRALDEATGSVLWHWDFSVESMYPPAVSGNRVYVTSTDQQGTALYSFGTVDGQLKFRYAFETLPWTHVFAPTVASGVVYNNGGGMVSGVFANDAQDGLPLWSALSGDDDMTTPAVADGKAYFYDGLALKVYDAFSGTTLASIADPYGPGENSSYQAAPMLGSPDSVTTFSGDASSGQASSEIEQSDSRMLANFSVVSQNTRWRTASLYKTQPAVANGVVYAGGNSPFSFDAISEATGQVLWSWVPSGTDTAFHRNVVVTKNLAFVSTDKAVYAIDLVSHKPVWSWPTPGTLSISGGGYLFIAEGARQSNGHLHAFKLW